MVRKNAMTMPRCIASRLAMAPVSRQARRASPLAMVASNRAATMQELERLAGEARALAGAAPETERSEEHTSELQSRENLVCRLLLEKKKIDLRWNPAE